MTKQALAGLVITELGSRLATGICGNLLMQMGATVICVETAQDNECYDRKGYSRPVMTAGKLSLAPKEGLAADEDMLARLIERSDLVLTSSDVDSPMVRRAIEGAKNTIVCDITAYGRTGPLAGAPATEFELQALSGVSETTGFSDGPPTPVVLLIISYLTGVYATIACLSALYAREHQGVTQQIDVAMFDCGFISLNTFLASTLTNPKTKQTRLGNRHPTVAPWNSYRTSNGWVLICAGTQAQWERLCATIGRPDFVPVHKTQGDRIRNFVEIDGAIEAWTKTVTTEQCIQKMVDINVACGPIAPVDQYPKEDNLDYRKMIRELLDPVSGKTVYVPGSPFRMSASPGKAPEKIPALDEDRARVLDLIAHAGEQAPQHVAPELTRPLSGVKIIELGQYTTAPLCAKQLAHLGAEVIKIERPDGDESRTWPPHIDGRSITFRLNNADKRSLTLDLTTEAELDALRTLIRRADVLVENMKPGTLSKFGLSPEAILKLNPRIIYCSISGFGADSLYAKRPAFDTVIQAMSGFMTSVAESGTPLKTGISASDTTGGIMAAVAILSALHHRLKTGEGQYIDLSMQDVSAWLTQTAWNDVHVAAPAIVSCSDGYVFAEAASDVVGAALNRSHFNTETASRDETVSLLRANNVQAFPVRTLREATQLPQTLERKVWFYLKSRGFEWPMLSSPLRLEKTQPFVNDIAPELNVDGAAILRENGVRLRQTDQAVGSAQG